MKIYESEFLEKLPKKLAGKKCTVNEGHKQNELGSSILNTI